MSKGARIAEFIVTHPSHSARQREYVKISTESAAMVVNAPSSSLRNALRRFFIR
jgi:hypothetical protein